MKENVKQEWVTALRSGEYEQCNGILRYTELNGRQSFCCLGVLTDLARKDGLSVEADDGTFIHNDEGGWLHPKVMDWAGLAEPDPVLRESSLVISTSLPTSLSVLNDSGRTFEEIADYIEEHL
jgi:hypothetical protein